MQKKVKNEKRITKSILHSGEVLVLYLIVSLSKFFFIRNHLFTQMEANKIIHFYSTLIL